MFAPRQTSKGTAQKVIPTRRRCRRQMRRQRASPRTRKVSTRAGRSHQRTHPRSSQAHHGTITGSGASTRDPRECPFRRYDSGWRQRRVRATHPMAAPRATRGDLESQHTGSKMRQNNTKPPERAPHGARESVHRHRADATSRPRPVGRWSGRLCGQIEKLFVVVFLGREARNAPDEASTSSVRRAWRSIPRRCPRRRVM